MAFVLSFVPHKSTKTPQNKRFIDFPSFFTGQNSTFAAAKQCSAKDLIGSKVFLDIIFSGFVPFLSRLRNIGERQKLEVIENKRVTIDKIGRNAVTTSNHQNPLILIKEYTSTNEPRTNPEQTHRSGATQGGWGIRSPVPHRGLSRSDWGVEEKAHAVRSDARGPGNTVPSTPTGGCHVVTEGWKIYYMAK